MYSVLSAQGELLSQCMIEEWVQEKLLLRIHTSLDLSKVLWQTYGLWSFHWYAFLSGALQPSWWNLEAIRDGSPL